METNLILMIVLGVTFNVSIKLIFRGFRHHFIGIDSMPAVPIIAGYLYGFSGGLWAGIIVSISYYLIDIKNISYAPLTITTNVFIGTFSAFFAGWTFIITGFLLLFIYHALSLFIVSIISQPKPGYFTFIILNFITTATMIYFASVYI